AFSCAGGQFHAGLERIATCEPCPHSRLPGRCFPRCSSCAYAPRWSKGRLTKAKSDIIAQSFREACLTELDALKPGNVHRHGAGHGMFVADFQKSAGAGGAMPCRRHISEKARKRRRPSSAKPHFPSELASDLRSRRREAPSATTPTLASSCSQRR